VLINVLKAKIHSATVTDAQIHYSGSISIDRFLMDKAGLLPHEKVMVVSLDSGERLETYVIEGNYGKGEIVINGAAARKILKGEKIIIMSFAQMDLEEYKEFEPAIVILGDSNSIVRLSGKDFKKDEC
jgi:aspartate 1-decarboxylase